MSAPRPTPGAPHPFSLPARERRALDNGLRLSLVPAGGVPKADVRLVIACGGIHEPADRVWLSKLATEYLREGAGGRSSGDLADAFAGMGGQLSVGCGDASTSIATDVLSENVPAAIRLLATVARSADYPASEHDRLVADLERSRAVSAVQPSTLATERFMRAVYGDHPYSRVLPAEGAVAGYSRDEAREFHAANFGAARARLYIGGVFDREAVLAAIHDAFGDWDAGPAPVQVETDPARTRTVHLVHRAEAEQSTIYLGLPVIDPTHDDWVPLNVMNALLGGSFHSRVTMNIREDKGWAYSPRSGVSARWRDGLWAQVADVTTAHTGDALAAILEEIGRLRTEAPGDDEVAGIRNYVVGAHVLKHATPSGILDQVRFEDFHGLDEGFTTGYVDRVNAVTGEHVRAMAERYLVPEQMTLVVAGDADVVKEQLTPFGELAG